ncbi:hypothetical protein MMC14_004165 [Varicellaria rhodocarpa]|nr:hypothetical protein [Varicellaria rhodocarpa]
MRFFACLSYVLTLSYYITHVVATDSSLLSAVLSLDNLLHTLKPNTTSERIREKSADLHTLPPFSTSSPNTGSNEPPQETTSKRTKILVPRLDVRFENVRAYALNSQVSVVCTGVCYTASFVDHLVPDFAAMLRDAIEILYSVAHRNPAGGPIPQAAPGAVVFQVLPSPSSPYRFRTYSVPEGNRLTWAALTLSVNALAIFLTTHHIIGFDDPFDFEVWDGNTQVGRGVIDYITN